MIREQHCQPVNADANAPRRGHAVHQRVDVVEVDWHRLFVPGLPIPLLLDEAGQLIEWVAALVVAMLISGGVLLLAGRIRRLLGDSVISATEKLMGLVLTAIAVEMILAGLKRYFFEPG